MRYLFIHDCVQIKHSIIGHSIPFPEDGYELRIEYVWEMTD